MHIMGCVMLGMVVCEAWWCVRHDTLDRHVVGMVVVGC